MRISLIFRYLIAPAKNSLEYFRVQMDIAGNSQSKYMGSNNKADEAWTDLTSSMFDLSTELL